MRNVCIYICTTIYHVLISSTYFLFTGLLCVNNTSLKGFLHLKFMNVSCSAQSNPVRQFKYSTGKNVKYRLVGINLKTKHIHI